MAIYILGKSGVPSVTDMRTTFGHAARRRRNKSVDFEAKVGSTPTMTAASTFLIFSLIVTINFCIVETRGS